MKPWAPLIFRYEEWNELSVFSSNSSNWLQILFHDEILESAVHVNGSYNEGHSSLQLKSKIMK